MIAANEGVDEPTKSLWLECSSGRHAARRGDHQARPRPRQLRQRAGRGAGGVRRQGASGVSGRRLALHRTDRSAVADALRVRRRQAHHDRTPRRVLLRCDRGTARHADRGNHRGVRGRDADGALPRRRGDRPGRADRRPGEGRRPRVVLPGHPGMQRHRRRHARTAGDRHQRISRRRRNISCPRFSPRRARPATAWPATRTGRCWPRWSRRRRIPTSAGSAWSGCSPGRSGPTRQCTCRAISRRFSVPPVVPTRFRFDGRPRRPRRGRTHRHAVVPARQAAAARAGRWWPATSARSAG